MKKDSDTLWDEAWVKINDRVEKKEIPTAQRDAMLKLWEELLAKTPELIKPFVAPSSELFAMFEDDTDYCFNWNYDKAPHIAISIYIRKSGAYEWFFNNSTTGDTFDGNGNLSAILTAFNDKMADFVK